METFGRLHPDDRYGVMQPLTIGKRSTLWLALTNHETPPAYVEAQELWRASSKPLRAP